MTSLSNRRRTGKKKAQKIHAIRRANERFRLDLSEQQHAALSNRIRRGLERDDAQFVRKVSASRSIWLLLVDGVWIPVVYDRSRHQIVTFLPRYSELEER